ncbi:MAG TPA: FkbM family methyltransferase [Anaerolineaceae bacterium]|nr:FkbM family methyltransferase [Anaerolineaceae bacterium]
MSFFRKWSYYAWSLLEMGLGFRDWGGLARLFLGKPTQLPATLRFRARDTRMLVRSRMDAWSVKETFLDRFYTRYGTAIAPGWTVVDIGAAIGEFTVFAALQAAQGEVLAFEPNPESFALLQANLKLNAIQNARAVCAGVWSEAGTMTLSAANGEPLQAQTVFSEAVGEGGQGAPVITLEQLLMDYTPQGIDLLKLDCEGAEYPILLATKPETLKAIRRIVMEYHDLDARQNHRVLKAYLENAGFQVRLRGNPVHQELGYLYACQLSNLSDKL